MVRIKRILSSREKPDCHVRETNYPEIVKKTLLSYFISLEGNMHSNNILVNP
jgi:hypothetical protein